MTSKIKIAFIYNPTSPFLTGNHFDNTTYFFFMHALKRNKKMDVTYFSAVEKFDTQQLKGKYDIILLPDNFIEGSPHILDGIDTVNIPVISRVGDPHDARRKGKISYNKKFKINYYFNFMSDSYFHKFYPSEFKYKTIIFGLEPALYENPKPFSQRIKHKIINSGAVGKISLKSRVANRVLNPKRSSWYFYKLRTLCNTLSYVDYNPMNNGRYIYDNYVEMLYNYRGAIAATTYYPTIKYWEIPASGCLTFMEITKKNDGEYLGYVDGKNAIFIDESNYNKKFSEFLQNPDDPHWEQIAKNGREYALANFSNDKATDKLVQLMEELI